MLFVLFALGGFALAPAKASAFTNDRLIDDGVFLNSQSMTPSAIQSFLQQRGSALASMVVTETLNYYPNHNQSVPVSQAIYDAAQVYGINPQVILATLQKEQSLITDPSPDDSQLRSAMGYGCPDNGTCSNAYAGLFYQIDNGTWQLRLNRERIVGNQSWWNPSINYACPGATRYYNPGLYTGNNVVFKDDNNVAYTSFVIATSATASLYCYTPHAYNNPTGAYGNPQYGYTGQYYSGSYNFVVSFNKWFGSPTQSQAFKSPNSSTVYLNVYGFKVIVPSMGMLQDFGINPNSIQTLNQSVIDAMPTPSVASNGISPVLSSVIKTSSDSDSDGGALYLTTVNKRYHIQSYQVQDYNLNLSDIAYLPFNYLAAIPFGGALSSFISTPTSATFKVDDGQKRIIFEYPTYIYLNPSNRATPVSYFMADSITSGPPTVDKPTLIKRPGDNTVYLYTNTYISITTFDAYQCWGFEQKQQIPMYQVYDSNYLAPITPSESINTCIFNNGSGATTLLNKNNRYTVPSSYGVSSQQISNSDLITIANKLPSSGTLKQYVNHPQTLNVWFIEGGVKKQVPTYSNFALLNINSSILSAVDSPAITSIPSSSVFKLAPGQVVKSSTSSSVYVIHSNSRLLYSSGDRFVAYKNNWGNIETYSQAMLDSTYPYTNKTVSDYFYDTNSLKLYLVDTSGCYLINTQQQTNYNVNQTTIAAAQTYTKSAFPGLQLDTCKAGSVYVKSASSATVYWLENGTKRAVSDWNKLLQHSGTNSPYIISLSAGALQQFTNGPVL